MKHCRLTLAFAWMLWGTIWAQTAQAMQPGVVRAEFIFDKADFAQCHASTIVESGPQLVAAWFGGTREGHSDVGIWLSRQDGTRWSKPVEVATGVQYTKVDGSVHRYPCWNPVLYQSPQGLLLLFYKCGPSPDRWWGMLMKSLDSGQTWSHPQRLPEGILGPVKNKPVATTAGELLCGSSSEHRGWRIHFEHTADQGETWLRTEPMNDGKEFNAIQPCILRHADGRLQALCRSKEQVILQTWSSDGGKAWSPLSRTDLPNNNSGLDAVTLDDGRQLLVYNHVGRTAGQFSGLRTPLNVAVSKDGNHWQAALVLESEPGEFSYPAVIQSADGLVHITYTWQRRKMKHVIVDPAKITVQAIRDGKWPAESEPRK